MRAFCAAVSALKGEAAGGSWCDPRRHGRARRYVECLLLQQRIALLVQSFELFRLLRDPVGVAIFILGA